MIISDTHRFAFLHNPKAGGTSVRATIEHLHDAPVSFWGTDPAREGPPLDRAHLGLDEIARLYPEIWARMRGYALFCLYRDPQARFFSSLAEYSKLHAETDTRFAPRDARKAMLMRLLDRLEGLGAAEALMSEYPLRHFRPQWIYWHAEDHEGLDMTALPVARIPDLFDAIAARSGAPLQPQRRNSGDQLALPGPLARLAGHRQIRRLLEKLPGAAGLKSALRGRYGSAETPRERFGLSETEAAGITQFLERFYARDRALWPETAAAGA